MSQAPYRIVLADDHVLIRHGIRSLIAQAPSLVIVGEVEGGADLAAVLSGADADLLILDISMPGVSGIDLIGLMKERHPGLKVLILTMHTGRQYLRRAIAAGADGYLVKSDSASGILAAIETIRNGGRYISPALETLFTEDILQALRDPAASPFKSLTLRESQILAQVAQGYTSREIAAALGISPRTVDHHRANLRKKFKIRNSVDLVGFAIKNGYVPLTD